MGRLSANIRGAPHTVTNSAHPYRGPRTACSKRAFRASRSPGPMACTRPKPNIFSVSREKDRTDWPADRRRGIPARSVRATPARASCRLRVVGTTRRPHTKGHQEAASLVEESPAAWPSAWLKPMAVCTRESKPRLPGHGLGWHMRRARGDDTGTARGQCLRREADIGQSAWAVALREHVGNGASSIRAIVISG